MKNVIAIVLTGLLAISVVARAADSPNALIEESVALLAERLDGRKEDLANDKPALYALIDEILLPRFDREYAAALVLGKHWRTASAADRRRFIEAFYRSLLRRYADGVLDFERGRVEVLPYRGDESKKRTMVKTIVQLEDGTKVPVNYALVNRDLGWLMFDVTIEGVSYVRNFRAELDAEIKASSLEQVIRRLEKEAGIAKGG